MTTTTYHGTVKTVDHPTSRPSVPAHLVKRVCLPFREASRAGDGVRQSRTLTIVMRGRRRIRRAREPLAWVIALAMFLCWQFEVKPFGPLRKVVLGTAGEWLSGLGALLVFWWATVAWRWEQSERQRDRRASHYASTLAELTLLIGAVDDAAVGSALANKTTADDPFREVNASADRCVRAIAALQVAGSEAGVNAANAAFDFYDTTVRLALGTASSDLTADIETLVTLVEGFSRIARDEVDLPNRATRPSHLLTEEDHPQ